MNDLDNLLRAARMAPEDDIPRLLLADWLEEYGNHDDRARAEFIRLQCQLARLAPAWPGRSDLEWRQRQLWWDHVEQWLGPIYDAASSFEFRRGLASVELNGKGASVEDDLFHASGWRWVEHLRLVRPNRRMMLALLDSPAAGQLQRLEIVGGEHLWDGALAGEYEDADMLQELRIHQANLNDSGLEWLAQWPMLRGLRVLDVSGNVLHGAGLEAIGHSAVLTRLEELDVSENPLWIETLGMAHLLSSPANQRLTSLGLRRAGYSGIISQMIRDEESPNLRELDLRSNALGDEDVRLLATSSILRRLRGLDLSDNVFDEDAILALTQTPLLDELETLDLGSVSLSRPALEALARAPRLLRLRRLGLQRIWVDSARVRGQLYQRFGGIIQW